MQHRRPVGPRRQPRGILRPALAGLLCVAAWLPASHATAQVNWLDVRRHGAAGVIDAAVTAEGSPPRASHYLCDTAPVPGWTGVQLEVARRAMPGKTKGTQVVVILRDARGAFLAGVANDAKGIWVRHGAAKAVVDNTLLFRDVPGLATPLAVFASLELSRSYEAKLEGEFDGSAILRLQPGYTEQAGLEPLKIGVSKQTLLVSIAEIDDVKGQARSRLLMIAPREHGEVVVPGQLRLRVRGEDRPVDLFHTRHDLGKAVRKKWGPAALR